MSQPGLLFRLLLILPVLLDIAPVLAPLAATGLATIMAGAAIVTYRRHELKHVLANLTYLALVVFVAVGRFVQESFIPAGRVGGGDACPVRLPPVHCGLMPVVHGLQ